MMRGFAEDIILFSSVIVSKSGLITLWSIRHGSELYSLSRSNKICTLL